MTVGTILKEISDDVDDVISSQFSYSQTRNVPNALDSGLSYERGKYKSGKLLTTCVLYVDIRDSVNLNDSHKSITMAKVYTAFTKAVIKAGRHHGGHTRNIIGDRVMIVFPSENCFTRSIECAITINHIANNILNKKFTSVDFRCGIGVDYGELRILKVGIQRNGTEGPQNKGMVWAGDPANLASRLTDMANKKFSEEYYLVERNPINPKAIKPSFPTLYSSYLGVKTNYDPTAPFYLSTTEFVEMSEAEFAKSFVPYTHRKDYFTSGGKMLTFERKTREYQYRPILVTNRVFEGLTKEKLRSDLIKSSYWHEEKRKIKDLRVKVYGLDLTWKI